MPNNPTFVAYIDESGDEGLRFHSGSSAWFALVAVVMQYANELSVVKLVDEVRTTINSVRHERHRIPDRKPLHFRDLPHDSRKYYAQRIAQSSVKALCVLIHKPDLVSSENFADGSRLYFYAVRLLVERISWYCRDHKFKDDSGDGSVEVVFSNRSATDYNALRSYVANLEANREALNYRGESGIVSAEQISTFAHGRRMGLQIADAVASSMYFAVEPSMLGFTEDAYGRLLLPSLYRRDGQLWGYGLKLFPPDAEEKRRTGEILSDWG